jgi:N utilization substance protein A
MEWDPNPSTFISNALSPAPVVSVTINNEEKAAIVVVPDRQLSLAIGREGQNARLAARLTGFRIDIKSASVAEAEELALIEQPHTPEEIVVEEPEDLVEVEQLETSPLEEEVVLLTPEELVPEIEAEEALPIEEEEVLVEEELISTPTPQLRFAEDILPTRAPKPDRKAKKGKRNKNIAVGDDKPKVVAKPKARRAAKIFIDEEELEEE